MDDTPVSSIELDFHNNDDGSTLSICTESNRSVVLTPNPNKTTETYSKDIPMLQKNPMNKNN